MVGQGLLGAGFLDATRGRLGDADRCLASEKPAPELPFSAPCSKVLCGWLLYCKCFLVILCGLFSQYSRVSGLFM